MCLDVELRTKLACQHITGILIVSFMFLCLWYTVYPDSYIGTTPFGTVIATQEYKTEECGDAYCTYYLAIYYAFVSHGNVVYGESNYPEDKSGADLATVMNWAMDYNNSMVYVYYRLNNPLINSMYEDEVTSHATSIVIGVYGALWLVYLLSLVMLYISRKEQDQPLLANPQRTSTPSDIHTNMLAHPVPEHDLGDVEMT